MASQAEIAMLFVENMFEKKLGQGCNFAFKTKPCIFLPKQKRMNTNFFGLHSVRISCLFRAVSVM